MCHQVAAPPGVTLLREVFIERELAQNSDNVQKVFFFYKLNCLELLASSWSIVSFYLILMSFLTPGDKGEHRRHFLLVRKVQAVLRSAGGGAGVGGGAGEGCGGTGGGAGGNREA